MACRARTCAVGRDRDDNPRRLLAVLDRVDAPPVGAALDRQKGRPQLRHVSLRLAGRAAGFALWSCGNANRGDGGHYLVDAAACCRQLVADRTARFVAKASGRMAETGGSGTGARSGIGPAGGRMTKYCTESTCPSSIALLIGGRLAIACSAHLPRIQRRHAAPTAASKRHHARPRFFRGGVQGWRSCTSRPAGAIAPARASCTTQGWRSIGPARASDPSGPPLAPCQPLPRSRDLKIRFPRGSAGSSPAVRTISIQ